MKSELKRIKFLAKFKNSKLNSKSQWMYQNEIKLKGNLIEKELKIYSTNNEIDKYNVKQINHSDRIKKDGLNLNTSQRDTDIETTTK